MGGDSDIAVLRTTSTAVGLVHGDMATGMSEAITFATASTSAGIDRADMAIGPDVVPAHVCVGGDTDVAELCTISTAAGCASATVGVGSDADIAILFTASTAAGVEHTDAAIGIDMVSVGMTDVGCSALVASTTTSRASGIDRSDM